MTHDLNKQKPPRNFFAEWNQREQVELEQSVSLLAILKDVSGLNGLKAFQPKASSRQSR